jgi:hypothetical protein
MLRPAAWTAHEILQKDFNFVKKYQLVSLLWLVSSMNGQNLVDLRAQTKNVDFSSAASTIPAKSGTTLPAACNPGEMFFNTNNAPGQNLYTCAPANTWTLLAGGSGTNGTVSAATNGQFGYYSASGTTIAGRTLIAGDIPALPYQTLLSFTGTGTKTATSTGNVTSNDCAKWDASGNVIDSGAPCGTSSQIASDWNANSGVTQILNKPVLGTSAAQNTSFFDLAGTASAAQAGSLLKANNLSDLDSLCLSGCFSNAQ